MVTRDDIGKVVEYERPGGVAARGSLYAIRESYVVIYDPDRGGEVSVDASRVRLLDPAAVCSVRPDERDVGRPARLDRCATCVIVSVDLSADTADVQVNEMVCRVMRSRLTVERPAPAAASGGDLTPWHPSMLPGYIGSLADSLEADATVGFSSTVDVDTYNGTAPVDTLRTDLAAVFGLAPDAPDAVLLATARKAWGGFDELVAKYDEIVRNQSAKLRAAERRASRLADAAGEQSREIERLRARVGAMLEAAERGR